MSSRPTCATGIVEFGGVKDSDPKLDEFVEEDQLLTRSTSTIPRITPG